MSTHLPMYVFTSQIPTIVISQAGIEPLNVRLMDGQKTLLETTLYPLAGQIKLYDIGRIYEEYLRSLNDEDYYPYIIMELEVGGTTWEDNMIIYCPHHCDIPAEEFITKHFLTTLNTKRVPADATREDEILPYLLTEEVAARNRLIIDSEAAFSVLGRCKMVYPYRRNCRSAREECGGERPDNKKHQRSNS